jgi:hypothetical protein
MRIKRDRKTAHLSKEMEGRDREREESVDSNDSIVTKCRWVLYRIEYRFCVV